MATAQGEIEDILNQLQRDHGWRVEARKGHPVALPPNRSLPPMTLSLTPGTHNWRKTLGAHLRRRGFNLVGTRVIPLAAAPTAAKPTPRVAPPTPLPPPRKDATDVAQPTRISPTVDEPGPDDIVSIKPAPIEVEGFPGKTTDKVMLVTFGDGRQVFECAEAKCGAQRDSLHKVLYHRRDHISRLRVVVAPPVEQAAEVQAEQEVAAQVIDGGHSGSIEVLVAVEPETPAASAEEDAPEMPLFDEDLSEILAEAERAASTITGLVRQVQKLRASAQILRDEAEQARRLRDEAESDLSEWRHRAHTAEAIVTQIKGIAGVVAA